MKPLMKTILLSAAAATFALASVSDASAWDRWHHGGWHGGGWGYGAAGLAGGLLLGSAIASQPRYYYDDEYAPPPVRYYAPPPPVYYPGPYAGNGLRPWSPQWMRYCEGRYRTFDARSGTFVGNDGMRHFCVPS
jgi:hypothetical protein